MPIYLNTIIVWDLKSAQKSGMQKNKLHIRGSKNPFPTIYLYCPYQVVNAILLNFTMYSMNADTKR